MDAKRYNASTLLTPPLKSQRLLILSALLMWCALLLLLRIPTSKTGLFVFLFWNLFLAVVPVPLATALNLKSLRRQWPLQLLVFGVWLAFLPNTFYILTDLIHLTRSPREYVWFDMIILLSCAAFGLFTGYLSLIEVHRKVESRFGVLIGWAVAMGVLFLCGLGIYLGRFPRWNSWQIMTHPYALFTDTLSIMTSRSTAPQAAAFIMAFSIGLSLGYLALHVLAKTITIRETE